MGALKDAYGPWTTREARLTVEVSRAIGTSDLFKGELVYL